MTAAPDPSQIPSGSVIITPEDMWRAIERIEDTGRRTESSVNELKLVVNPALHDLREDVDENARIARVADEKLADRIRVLEEASWSSRWVPAIVMSLLASTVAGVVVYVITHINP